MSAIGLPMNCFGQSSERQTTPKTFGVTVRILQSEEHAYSEFIDLAALARAITPVYPLVYVNLTYDPDRVRLEAFHGIQARFELVQVYQMVRPGTLFLP